MAVKVGQIMSGPRIVLGGVPQGSILGVYLFNATIDSFEAGSNDFCESKVIGGDQGHVERVVPHDRSLNT